MNVKTTTLLLIPLAIIGLVFMLATSSSNNDEETEKTTQQGSSDSIELVDAQTFQNEIEKEDVVVLDVRTPEEFANGRIAGSQNIDFYAPSFEQQINMLDRDKKYKIYCNSGNRSASTISLMKELGFTNVTELAGGIQAWNAQNLPTCTSC